MEEINDQRESVLREDELEGLKTHWTNLLEPEFGLVPIFSVAGDPVPHPAKIICQIGIGCLRNSACVHTLLAEVELVTINSGSQKIDGIGVHFTPSTDFAVATISFFSNTWTENAVGMVHSEDEID